MKQAVRSQIRRKQADADCAEEGAKSQKITERICASLEFARAKVIHIYMAKGTEVQTDPLIEKAFSLGKRVVVPAIAPPNLRFFEIHDLRPEHFQVGPWGIREPKIIPDHEVLPEAIDLWILPGVAYDLSGRRLGSGGGYYDRLFAMGKTPCRAMKIAPAFELQVCDSVPYDATDIRVDQIVTEERTIICSEERYDY